MTSPCNQGKCIEVKGCPAVTKNPQAGESTQRAKGKAQELAVNCIIYSAALPFICEIKQTFIKLYVAKYYCYSHGIYYI